MRPFLALCLTILSTVCFGQGPYTPINRGRLQTDLDGNGKSITNLAGTFWTNNSRFKAVSPNGISNGRSLILNDGADFGPDTTGTTTKGIHEAINALYQTNGYGSVVGGGTVRLLSGQFDVSGQGIIPNQFPFNLTIEGEGEAATSVNYSGNTNFLVEANPTKVNNLNLVMRNFKFSYLNDSNKMSIVRVGGGNEMLLENLIFVTSHSFHSNLFGSPMVWYTGVPTNPVGVVGFWTDQGANKFTIKECRFFGLAAGIVSGNDHNFIDNCLFGNIGRWFPGGGSSPSFGTTWSIVPSFGNANTALTNMISHGAAIICNANTYEMNIDRCQWFNCYICWMNRNSGQGPILRAWNPFVETCDYRSLITIDENGEDFGKETIFSLTTGTTGLSGDAYMYLTNGAIVTSTPAKESVREELIVADDGMSLAVNGTNWFTMTSGGDQTIRGRYLTPRLLNPTATNAIVTGSGTNVSTPALKVIPGLTDNNLNGPGVVILADPSAASDSFQVKDSSGVSTMLNIDTSASLNLFNGNLTLHNGDSQWRQNGLFLVRTQAYFGGDFPAAPASRGGCAIINSNGWVYMLNSLPNTLVWAKTNLLGAPQ